MPKDGGPAFPTGQNANSNNPDPNRDNGMSLRDWFAGQALAGLLTEPLQGGEQLFIGSLVRSAFSFADAMLKQREAKDGC